MEPLPHLAAYTICRQPKLNFKTYPEVWATITVTTTLPLITKFVQSLSEGRGGAEIVKVELCLQGATLKIIFLYYALPKIVGQGALIIKHPAMLCNLVVLLPIPSNAERKDNVSIWLYKG